MDQPVGFVLKGQENKVCCLKRYIYGLKQSSKSCYSRFHQVIISFSLTMVSEDHSLYVEKITEGVMFLSLYVDNILLAGNNMRMI